MPEDYQKQTRPVNAGGAPAPVTDLCECPGCRQHLARIEELNAQLARDNDRLTRDNDRLRCELGKVERAA